MRDRKAKQRVPLALKFFLTLVMPLVLVSVWVTFITNQGLEENAKALTEALETESDARSVLPLLLVQDDASKTMLIDVDYLAAASERKIEAYDGHKKILQQLAGKASSEEFKAILARLEQLDGETLRPLDTKILETLFEDPKKAAKIYFDAYEPERKKYELAIRELSSIASRDAEQAAKLMASQNRQSLIQILVALVLGIVVVIAVIVILSRQVELSESNMKSLLGSLHEGLFFFSADGKIAPERSQALAKIFPESVSCHNIGDFCKALAGTSPQTVDTCLELLWQDPNADDSFHSDFSTTVSMLPSKVVRTADGQSQFVQLRYKPIYVGDSQLSKVIVIVEDITERIRNEEASKEQAERILRISKAAINTDAFIEFAREMTTIFERVTHQLQGSFEDIHFTQLRRDLHTIKGSVGAFEFGRLANLIHDLEDLMVTPKLAELDTARRDWHLISQTWNDQIDGIKSVLGLTSDNSRTSVDLSKLAGLVEYAKGLGKQDLMEKLASLRRDSLDRALIKYSSYMSKLSSNEMDKKVRLTFSGSSAELSTKEVQAIDGALVHLFRNCFDHGIESIEKRKQAGKPEFGTISVECQRGEGVIRLSLEDDGGGINTDKLAQKAIENGLWDSVRAQSASAADKMELIFAPNLSSKDEVSDISGRGVGMDAVRDMLESMGGKIQVRSEPGRGTCFDLEFPEIHDSTEAKAG